MWLPIYRIICFDGLLDFLSFVSKHKQTNLILTKTYRIFSPSRRKILLKTNRLYYLKCLPVTTYSGSPYVHFTITNEDRTGIVVLDDTLDSLRLNCRKRVKRVSFILLTISLSIYGFGFSLPSKVQDCSTFIVSLYTLPSHYTLHMITSLSRSSNVRRPEDSTELSVSKIRRWLFKHTHTRTHMCTCSLSLSLFSLFLSLCVCCLRLSLNFQ